MNAIEPVGFLPPTLPLPDDLAGPPGVAAPPSAAPFARWFATQLEATNTKVVAAEQGLQDLATGRAQSLHHVMLGLEEARLSLQLVSQVRNRLLEAYADLMRMQL